MSKKNNYNKMNPIEMVFLLDLSWFWDLQCFIVPLRGIS